MHTFLAPTHCYRVQHSYNTHAQHSVVGAMLSRASCCVGRLGGELEVMG